MYDPTFQHYRPPTDPSSVNEDASKYSNQRSDSDQGSYPENKYQQSVDGSVPQMGQAMGSMNQPPPYPYSNYIYGPYLQQYHSYRNPHPAQQQFYRYYSGAYPNYTNNTSGYPSSASSMPATGGYPEEMLQEYSKGMFPGMPSPFFHPGVATTEIKTPTSRQDLNPSTQQQVLLDGKISNAQPEPVKQPFSTSSLASDLSNTGSRQQV